MDDCAEIVQRSFLPGKHQARGERSRANNSIRCRGPNGHLMNTPIATAFRITTLT